MGQKIIHIPDFLVLDAQKGKPHLAEVKFRWDPAGHESDDEKFDALVEKYLKPTLNQNK